MFIRLFDGEKTIKQIMLRNPEVQPGTIIKHLNLAYRVVSILHVTSNVITVWVEEVQNA